jgi:Trk K+ transport system NAD-binding subunit
MLRWLKRRPPTLVRLPSARERRAALLSALSFWNRYQALRIVAAVLIAWVVGVLGIHMAEQGQDSPFNTWPEAIWSVWVLLFSGLDEPPKTPLGRLFAMVLLGAGVGLAGLFTGTVASVLVEHQLRRRDVVKFEMEDHLVLCNWSPRGVAWIREVHSKIIQDKRPVVVIHDDTEQVDLPDTQDDTAFQDVYLIRGDPTNEVILRRARVSHAHSVVVLSDDRQGDHADGKTILTCIAVRNISRSAGTPNIAVECRNPNYRHHLLKAGADEVISSDEFGVRLLARTALYHGITRVYQELLTVGRDANEMFVIPVPEEFVGRDFAEVSGMFVRHRDDRRSCLLIGIERDDEMILNPVGAEAGPVRAADQLIVLSRVFLTGHQMLPTVPPVPPRPVAE